MDRFLSSRSMATPEKCVKVQRADEQTPPKDHGIDPTSLLQAHVSSSTTSGVEESLPTFCPEANGYDTDFLASLPPDAPCDHIAFSKTRCGVDSLGTRKAIFYFNSDTGLKIPFQVTERSTDGSLYAAFRIARHCYLHFEKGLDKESVVALRNELAFKLRGKFVKQADSMEPADVAKANATAKKKMRVGKPIKAVKEPPSKRQAAKEEPCMVVTQAAKEEPSKDENMGEDMETRMNPNGVWWSCPRCAFTLPESMHVGLRNGRKTFHIMHHGSNSETAKSKNFKVRAKMLRAVWDGRLKKTPGKLIKKDLKINAKGRIVPKKRSAHSARIAKETGWAEARRRWTRACKVVRLQEGVVGFMKLKREGTATEKRRYMKVVEATSQELVNNLNTTLQQMGSNKQMKITRFALPAHVKNSPSASSPPAFVPASSPALVRGGA